MDEPVILFKNVSKKFYLQEDKTFKELIPHLLFGKPWAREIPVLDDINFKISKGECVGIIGKNGAGKSTILKLIAGVTSPTTGNVHIEGKVAPLIELGAGFHPELTGYENIFLNASILGMHRKEIQQQVEEIINFSELKDFMDIPVKRYSSGMYMRLAFSIAIHTNAPILLIDEVLAVGDQSFQDKCFKFLLKLKQAHSKTIIFVSHSEAAVKSFCDRVILLSKGKVILDTTPEKAFKRYNNLPK